MLLALHGLVVSFYHIGSYVAIHLGSGCLCVAPWHLWLSPVAAMQMEFDPALELDVVHAPNGWQAADLFVSPAEFLDSMKPLLDDYLAAQGQPPVQKLEWQVSQQQ